MRRLLLPALFAATPGLAQEAPTEWLGPTPHMVVAGTIDGHAVDVSMPDMAAAEAVASFAGKREYLPGEGGAWRYGDFEVALQARLDGVDKSIEFEFENADFAAHPLPATFALGEANFPKGEVAFLEAQVEWETAAETVNAEVGGWAGTLTLTADEGTPDAEGLVPDGMIGGFVTATRGADRLVASFTVPVTTFEKDD